MTIAGWAALLAGAFIAGVALVALLIVPRDREPWSGLLGIVSVGVSAWGFWALVNSYGRADITVAAAFLGIGVTVGGYGLAASMLPNLAPAADPVALDPGPDDGRIHVILLACSEPETYDVRTTAREFADLVEAGAPETPVALAPFFYAAQKTRYRAVGGRSPSRDAFRALGAAVNAELPPDLAPVALAWCEGVDRLTAVVAEAVARGARRIAVVPLTVADGYLEDRAQRELDAMRPTASSVRVITTPALWSSDPVAEAAARMITDCAVGEMRTGVVLVGHGQPPSWASSHPGFDIQETSFIQRVRVLLCERGIAEGDVRVAFAEWREPGITESVRHLAALGCHRVLVSPTCFPVPTIATSLDFQHAAAQARAEISWRVLPTWSEDQRVAAALAEMIENAAAELDE